MCAWKLLRLVVSKCGNLSQSRTLSHQSESGPKWTVQKGESGRFKSVKLDGPKVSNLTVQKCQTGRSDSIKLDVPKVLKLAAQEYRTAL